MENITLSAEIREKVGKQANSLRSEEILPAVIYGHGLESKNIQIDYKSFIKVFSQAGESSLIDVKVGDQEPVKALIQSTQQYPVTDRYLHVDFYQVRMDEKISAEVGLKYIGESKAVRELGGVLIKNLDKVHVKCFPGDLVHQIEIDLAKLENYGDAIHIEDLNVSDKIELTGNPGDPVVVVSEPRKQEETHSVASDVAGEGKTDEASDKKDESDKKSKSEDMTKSDKK